MNDILRISVKWGLSATASVAIFWGVWSLFADVPETILLLSAAVNDPAKFLSRWWDIPGAFLAGCLMGTYWKVLGRFGINNPNHPAFDFFFGIMFLITSSVILILGAGAGFLNGLSIGLLLMFTFFTILYVLAALKQVLDWEIDIVCGAYKELAQKPKGTEATK